MCTYNVLAPVAPPIRMTSQATRMSLIPGEVAAFEADIVCVQESIVPAQHRILSAGMQREGYYHETEPLSKMGKVVNGGVVIFSKYPIEAQEQVVFTGPCDGSDCLAAKGLVYARINRFGVLYHFVGVHFQAWPNARSREIRKSQAQQTGAFLAKLPKTEPVIVLGDLNVDLYSERRHLMDLLELLDCDMMPRAGPQMFTSDPATNFLMGIDETTAYSSPEHPGGCEELHMKSGSCACAPQEWLDYVLVPRGGMKPDAGQMECRPVKHEFYGQVNMTTWRTLEDLSDHYPVVGSLFYKSLQNRRLPHVREETPRHWMNMTVGVIVLLVLLGLGAAAIVLLTKSIKRKRARRVPSRSSSRVSAAV